MSSSRELIGEEIAGLIHLIRGKRVLLDSDLADLYGVETKRLNRAVKRNLERFPQDFMFQLTFQEVRDLRCQIGTLETGGKGEHSKYLSYVFTQEGVAMLSSVLRSREAIAVNIEIMRAFVAMREMISTHVELSRKLEQLEYRLGQHDEEIAGLFEAIKQLMKVPDPKKNARIGF
jgi:hypothetical protein